MKRLRSMGLGVKKRQGVGVSRMDVLEPARYKVEIGEGGVSWVRSKSY